MSTEQPVLTLVTTGKPETAAERRRALLAFNKANPHFWARLAELLGRIRDSVVGDCRAPNGEIDDDIVGLRLWVECGIPFFSWRPLSLRRIAELRQKAQLVRERPALGHPALTKRTGCLPDNVVARRRKIVRRGGDARNFELCRRLESEDVPVPSGWGGVTWRAAYRDPRLAQRVHALLARDRAANAN